MKQILLLFIVCSLFTNTSIAQVFTNKEVGRKNAELIDSLKNSDYPYSLPIWGEKATRAGYALPYSAGISMQYFTQKSDLIIENLKVGFNNGPMYDLDGLVRFDKAIATASAVTIRPDIWLFPFLNIYAILGKTQASTDVGFGLWIPDSSGTDQLVFSAGSTVNFKATSFGLGITPTIGVGGGFLALDMNVAWTDVPQLSKPAMSFIFGPRLGKNFKLKNPESTIAVWAGGFRVKINSGTDGSLNMDDALPLDELGIKVDNGIARVDNAQQQIDSWWAGLSLLEQNNPVNKAKYNSANAILERAGQILYSADNALNDGISSTVQYSMDKRPADKWNFIVGSQFQLNKHFMIRAEVGFLASRTQVMAGLQYRFGL
jgi:hypothetical protein